MKLPSEMQKKKIGIKTPSTFFSLSIYIFSMMNVLIYVVKNQSIQWGKKNKVSPNEKNPNNFFRKQCFSVFQNYDLKLLRSFMKHFNFLNPSLYFRSVLGLD